MDTDPNPVTVDIPMDAHISLFLRHARRCAEDTAAGLAVDIAPPDTSTEIVVGTAPGVATPMVVVGPTTDGDFGTADGAFPYGDDFDPIIAGSDRDEVTAVAPDGADLEPTSPDLTSTRGGDTTAAMPVGTGQVVDDVSDGGFGTDDFADEVLSDDVVDFDPHSAWDDGDEVTAAAIAGVPTRKRKHMTATRADDAGGSATATADLDPNSAWGDDDVVATANDFGPISDWDGEDEVTTANALAATDDTTRRRKRRRRHVGPAESARYHIRIQAYAPQSPQPGRS